jgi:hypothetical protein
LYHQPVPADPLRLPDARSAFTIEHSRIAPYRRVARNHRHPSADCGLSEIHLLKDPLLKDILLKDILLQDILLEDIPLEEVTLEEVTLEEVTLEKVSPGDVALTNISLWKAVQY